MFGISKCFVKRTEIGGKKEKVTTENAEHPDADCRRHMAPDIDHIGKLLDRKASRSADEDLQIHRLFLLKELSRAEPERKHRDQKRCESKNNVLHTVTPINTSSGKWNRHGMYIILAGKFQSFFGRIIRRSLLKRKSRCDIM